MPVDAELQPILAELNKGPPLKDVPLELLRQGSPIPSEPPAHLESVVNRSIALPHGDVRVRIYHPHTRRHLPMLVFFHGGGFVLGSLDSHDSLARMLALGADCIVVSVDYRLAPEHRFPTAVEDCFAALCWAHEHAVELGAVGEKIIVGGDSAGGNLATVAALRARDEGGPVLAGQLLVYPVTQLRAPLAGSMLTNGEGYFLRAIDMTWFEDMYLGATGAEGHAHASPLSAPDLTQLPPALVLTAEFDPLLDQGIAYARRLGEARVQVDHRHYAGAIHGFFGMPTAIGRRAVSEACTWLSAAFR
jgi:acetyl esterase